MNQQTTIQSQKSYWLVKESNEYEYEEIYYAIGTFEQIKNKMRNYIQALFKDVQVMAYITDNKIKFKVENVLDHYDSVLDYYYSFETFEIEAIKKPNIKSNKHLKYDVYDQDSV